MSHDGTSAPFHPTAWLLWGAAALVAVLLTQNPLYLTLIFLALLWVRSALGAGPMALPLPLLALMPLLSAAANALTIHSGETVVGRLPQGWPLLGGPITLEAIVHGLVAGYALVVLLVLFAALGAGSRRAGMLRMVPGFLFQAGLVTTIALAFVPQTLRSLNDIREAQQIRGQRFKSWRDLPPLFLPLLTMGLERSIQLAEAMESRGFGATPGARQAATLGARLALLAGLIVVVGGAALTVLSTQRAAGLVTVVAGVAIAAAALARMGQRVARTRYRPILWTPRDRLLATASVAALVGLAFLALRDPLALSYYPYPRLAPPPFDSLIGAAMALVALPALLLPKREKDVGATDSPQRHKEHKEHKERRIP